MTSQSQTRHPRRRRLVGVTALLLAAAVFFAMAVLQSAGWLQDDSSAASPTAGAKAERIEVHSGAQLRTALRQASGGTNIVLYSGAYETTTIDRSYSPAIVIRPATGQRPRVAGFHIASASGVLIRDVSTIGQSDVVNGSHDITFFGVHCKLPIGDRDHSCFYLHDSSRKLVVRNSTAVGGFDGVKLYGCSGSAWTSGIMIANNDISQASEDLIHVNCARDVTIRHNFLHDPIDNEDHNDGVQSQASDGLKIFRNTFTFTRPNSNGPNQAIILGRTGPPSSNLVTNSTVSGNLIHHWPGIPIVLDGTQHTTVVNNTAWDSGEAANQGLTISGSGDFDNTDVRVWNNILGTIWIDPGASAPAFCEHNLLQLAPQEGICSSDLRLAEPRFLDHVQYELARGSPGWAGAGDPPGTPLIDIDGTKCDGPRLGARCVRP